MPEHPPPTVTVVPCEAPAPRALLPGLARAPGLALLESTAEAPGGGRWSILAWGPRGYLQADADGCVAVTAAGVRRTAADPFQLIDDAFRDRGATGPPPEGLPFASGLIGYLGYGLRRWVEALPDAPRPSLGTPDMWLGWYDGAIVWDHAAGRCWLAGRDKRGARFVERVGQALARGRNPRAAWPDVDNYALPDPESMGAPFPLDPFRRLPEGVPAGATTSLPRAKYEAAVERVRTHILDGDSYVLNLSQQIHATAMGAPHECYAALTERAPVPYAALLTTGAGALIGASPERFLSRRGAAIETRPIKGTRPRHLDDAADDAGAAAELLANAKETAELTMIVDLCRSDLGRVAEVGSVDVAVMREVESFRTVHQAVATIRATQRPGVTLGGLLRAAFPAGSVTGCPKVRAMEIIDAVETVERGPYTGA
ncbi:MAG: anthranilate synthase component I family protein, partial [Planctomycetota bacterium]